MRALTTIILTAIILASCSQASIDNTEEKQKQLSEIKSKQILVAMWGWEPEIMAPAAIEFGYDIVNQPQNSDTIQHALDIPVWHNAGLGMLVRPDLFCINDPFDPEQVKAGYEKMKNVILFHERNNPNVVAYVIQWGLFGEGGFVWNYKFSDKAREAFNRFMKTPGLPLPEGSQEGKPGSLRWIKWLEFRSAYLSDFRAEYVEFAKQFTDKLVGTWSEVYPTEHYVLNMGDAPGADFMYYDLSFGDVTCNQRIAFGESHGEMEAFPDFESWLKHELPLMAKGAGEGVTPIAFQFPMREGHDVKNIGGRKQYTIDKIEDEYSLKLGPYIRELLDAVADPLPEPEVALVYQSFQASALPAGPFDKTFANSVMPLYRVHSKAIEGALHQMGVNMRAIPYEWLGDHDLSQYKLVIIPDPLYLSPDMRANLGDAQRVLYSGEFLLAHRDTLSEKGSYLTDFYARVNDSIFSTMEYIKNKNGRIEVSAQSELMKRVTFPEDEDYPSDQMFLIKEMPGNADVLATVNNLPVIFTIDNGKSVFVANRAFSHAWDMEQDWLENGMFLFLKNLLISSHVNVPVVSMPQARANKSNKYGSYGVSGNIAWNTTGSKITLELETGKKIVIPEYAWVEVE